MARILIADDQEDILSIIASVCEFDAHEPRTEPTLEGTVKAFVEFDPALMILDVHMSHQGGAREILTRLDKLGGTGECRVVVMTGIVDESAESMAQEERVRAVIQKPFSVEFLRQTIQDALA